MWRVRGWKCVPETFQIGGPIGIIEDHNAPIEARNSAHLAAQEHSGIRVPHLRTRVRFPPPPLLTGGICGVV